MESLVGGMIGGLNILRKEKLVQVSYKNNLTKNQYFIIVDSNESYFSILGHTHRISRQIAENNPKFLASVH